jgi:hypothetical protein
MVNSKSIKLQEGLKMLFHLLVALAMLASVIAFVILWYFWVKKRLDAADITDVDQNILFPFRHFSWLLIGLIVFTCLAQVHFARVSSGVYEDLDAMASFLEEQRAEAMNIRELERSLKELHKDVSSRMDGLRELSEKTIQTVMKSADSAQSRVTSNMEGSPELSAQTVKRANAVVMRRRSASPKPPDTAKKKGDAKPTRLLFAGAARAASPGPIKEQSTDPEPASANEPQAKVDESEVLSMQLDLPGTVNANVLLVRSNPEAKAKIVDRVRSGEVVHVSEKRMIDNDRMWYAVTTPRGKNGWVDYQFIKLQTNSDKKTDES